MVLNAVMDVKYRDKWEDRGAGTIIMIIVFIHGIMGLKDLSDAIKIYWSTYFFCLKKYIRKFSTNENLMINHTV